MTKSSWLMLYLGLTLLLFSSGCAPEQRPQTLLEQICLPGLGRTQALQTAERVLARMHFHVDKADYRHGILRTRPLPGAQFFEFWRKDNVGSFNVAEANLQSIRRTVELTFNQEQARLCIVCNVNVERLNLPEYELPGRGYAYQLYSESDSAIQELKLHPEQKKEMTWIKLGTDPKLASAILKRLKNRLDKPKERNSL